MLTFVAQRMNACILAMWDQRFLSTVWDNSLVKFLQHGYSVCPNVTPSCIMCFNQPCSIVIEFGWQQGPRSKWPFQIHSTGGMIKVNNVLQFDFTSNFRSLEKLFLWTSSNTPCFKEKRAWKAAFLVCVNAQQMFILNKHSTRLSNTFCILRPSEDSEKYAAESEFEQCQQGIHFLICSHSQNIDSKKLDWFVLPPQDLKNYSVIILTLNNCILAASSAKKRDLQFRKHSRAFQQNVSLSSRWRKVGNKLLFHGKPLWHYNMYYIKGPHN